MIIVLLGLLAVVSAASNLDNKDSYKNQFRSGHSRRPKGNHDDTNFSIDNCTDPRTMKRHAAYTEWADAYSCTRHRCQPGGRNLAIYTVGCKRVEAPESAIECEEVVEDTNMQFPFCCTRLRCLVVVRGEVWTRVLGQPWEVLPAAPWSHMYKMKKPPPADSSFLPKTPDQGPIYELTDADSDQGEHDKVHQRSGNNAGSDGGDSPVLRAAMPSPDIVIALSTNNERRELASTKKPDISRHSKRRLQQPPAEYYAQDVEKGKAEQGNPEIEEVTAAVEKQIEEEHEKFVGNSFYPATKKPFHKSRRHENTYSPISWTEIPISQWNEPKEMENLIDLRSNEHSNNEEPQLPTQREPKHEALQIRAKKETVEPRDMKPTNLQALVDAIGTRMRDIESVVQKMSDKVHQVKATTEGSSKEKRVSAERDGSHKYRKEYKRPSAEDENYKSDASNSILRRNSQPKMPKEPPQTYMAPVVEKHHKTGHSPSLEPSDDSEKKHKKHAHKKKRSKAAHTHRKRSRSKEDKNKVSAEAEKNAVSMDESGDLGL